MPKRRSPRFRTSTPGRPKTADISRLGGQYRRTIRSGVGNRYGPIGRRYSAERNLPPPTDDPSTLLRRYATSRNSGYSVVKLDNIPGLSKNERRKAQRLIAQRLSRALSGPRSKWPVDTGLSKSLWQVRSVGDGLKITNRAYSNSGFPYPYFVNSAKTLRGGKTNKNFHAIQRTIRAVWDDVTRGALDR